MRAISTGAVEGLELDGPGIPADVAPTILDLLGTEKPEAMTGRSLIDASSGELTPS